MPLNPLTMQAEILKITGVGRPEHEGFPADTAEAAARWSSAVRAYFAEAVVPPVMPPGLDAAREAMRARMAVDLPAGGPVALMAGLMIFGATLASSAGAAPPAAPPVVPPLPPTTDPLPPATALATVIDLWARTGIMPPGLPWS